MIFKLEIDMDNEAFGDFNGDEVADILNEVCKRVRYIKLKVHDHCILQDINGNNVGEWIVTKD